MYSQSTLVSAKQNTLSLIIKLINEQAQVMSEFLVYIEDEFSKNKAYIDSKNSQPKAMRSESWSDELVELIQQEAALNLVEVWILTHSKLLLKKREELLTLSNLNDVRHVFIDNFLDREDKVSKLFFEKMPSYFLTNNAYVNEQQLQEAYFEAKAEEDDIGLVRLNTSFAFMYVIIPITLSTLFLCTLFLDSTLLILPSMSFPIIAALLLVAYVTYAIIKNEDWAKEATTVDEPLRLELSFFSKVDNLEVALEEMSSLSNTR